MQSNLPQSNLLVPGSAAIFLKFVWSPGMDPWYSMTPIHLENRHENFKNDVKPIFKTIQFA